MNLNSVGWIVGALFVLGLAAVNLTLGMSLMPSLTAAQGKGIFVPWLFTWGLIWSTALIAVAIAGFMISVSKARSQ